MITAIVAIVAAVAMEVWAAVVHERAWHGVLWPMHRSHHRPGRGWNANDALSLSHAPVAIASIAYGAFGEGLLAEIALGWGVGMTAFGAGYVLVHDGFVHGRLPALRFLRRVPYFERVRRAHLVHHGTNGRPYGLFWPR